LEVAFRAFPFSLTSLLFALLSALSTPLSAFCLPLHSLFFPVPSFLSSFSLDTHASTTRFVGKLGVMLLVVDR
jgi:hypothetical protein